MPPNIQQLHKNLFPVAVVRRWLFLCGGWWGAGGAGVVVAVLFYGGTGGKLCS